MNRSKGYTFMYIVLIAISILAPETYGVSLKYVIIPLAGMLFFSLLGNKIDLKITLTGIVGVLWIVLTIVSTRMSTIVSWSASARSFCLLILFFVLLYDKNPDEKQMLIIKNVYVALTLFCAGWIAFQAVSGINRYSFPFLFGFKDVNYLASFMLPGFYMSVRFLFFEKMSHRWIYALCAVGTIFGLFFIQSRAPFVAVLIMGVFLFMEYMQKNKLSARKIGVYIFTFLAVIIVGVIVWNHPALSRLTSSESYEDNIRLTIWTYAIQAFVASPMIGSGLGASNFLSNLPTGYDTHCNYIDILGDTGILGMLFFVILSAVLLKVKKGHRLHMISYYIVCMFPLAFINGLQTISFWLPMLLLAHEHFLIEKTLSANGNDLSEPQF